MEAIMKKTMIKQLIGVVCIGLAFSASATEWTYTKSGTDNVITNGQWTLKVTNLDKEAGVFTLTDVGSWTDPGDSSSGVLDLRSPLILKEGDTETTEIKSIKISKGVFANWKKTDYDKVLEFYCDIISDLLDGNTFKQNAKITKVEVGGSAETMATYFLYSCSALQTAKFNFPNLRKIESSFLTACKNPIDITTILKPAVTNIAGYAFQGTFWRGDIALTNVMALGEGTFKTAPITNVYLAGTITSLPKDVFRGDSGGTITNVVLDLPKLTSIHREQWYAAFYNQTKIRRVELVQALADMGLVTNIVNYANNSTIGALRIYVSKKQWEPSKEQKYDASSNPTGFFSAITDKEKAELDAETQKKVIGVLVCDGTPKGIFVHKASKYDKPTGFAISIR